MKNSAFRIMSSSWSDVTWVSMIVFSLIIHAGMICLVASATEKSPGKGHKSDAVYHVNLVDLPSFPGKGGRSGGSDKDGKDSSASRLPPKPEPPPKKESPETAGEAAPAEAPEEKEPVKAESKKLTLPSKNAGKEKKKPVRKNLGSSSVAPNVEKGEEYSSTHVGQWTFNDFVVRKGGSGSGGGGGFSSSASINLDADEFAFLYYLKIIKDKISRNWNPSLGVLPAGTSLNTTIYFLLSKNGQASDVAVEESSGNILMDKSCLRAVMMASPFPPLPYEYGGDSLGVHFGFEFTPEY